MDVSDLTNDVVSGTFQVTNTINMDQNPLMFPQLPSVYVTWPQVAMYLVMTAPITIPLFINLLKTLKMEKVQQINSQNLKTNTELTAKTSSQLVEVHDKVNGKMEALIEAKVKAALAEGRITGAQEEKAKNVEALANQAIGAASSHQTAGAVNTTPIPIPIPISIIKSDEIKSTGVQI